MLNIHHTILYFWYRLLISIRLSLSWRKSLIILDTQNIVCILVQSSETNRNTKRIHLSTDKKRLKIPMTFFHRLFDANFSNFPVTLAEKDTQDFYIIYNIDIFMLSVSAFSDILIIDQVIGLGLALAMVHIQAGVFLAIFLYGRT